MHTRSIYRISAWISGSCIGYLNGNSIHHIGYLNRYQIRVLDIKEIYGPHDSRSFGSRYGFGPKFSLVQSIFFPEHGFDLNLLGRDILSSRVQNTTHDTEMKFGTPYANTALYTTLYRIKGRTCTSV